MATSVNRRSAGRWPFLLAALVLVSTFAAINRAQRAAEKHAVEMKPLPFSFECRWTDDPITIDGKADEPAWAKAQAIDNFTIHWKAGHPKASTTTKANLLWDRDYLYFHADLEDHDLFADLKEHDSQTWNNDVFELFFKPADDKPGYYEFQATPLNTTLDMFLPSREGGGWAKFKDAHPFEFKTAVVVKGTIDKRDDRDEGWSVEGRIRWQDMSMTGGRPAIGESWKFALCRYDYTKGKDPELSTCAPLTQGSFHRYEDYATLKFVGPDGAKPVGLDQRVIWDTSRVVGFPEGLPPYRVERAFPKLKVFQPIYVAAEPGSDRLLIVQHLGPWAGPGKILRIQNREDVDSAETLLTQDRLIYGLTFHPKFTENGYLYLISNGPMPAENKQNRISRFTMDRKAPFKIDPASELVILEWDSNGHNGGELGFGPDGMLYCAAGDGTTDSDTNLRGQDVTHLNSAMIRIDVDHPDGDGPYSIPKDNPKWDVPGARPEVWAFGFRNPWRMTFDAKRGTLWVGNNGQDLWEQVYIVHKGDNFGWSITEGSHDFYPTRKRGPAPIVKPTIEHPHSEARSLTGGVVYYGKGFPELEGVYLYGDFGTGRIWGARHDGTTITEHRELAKTTIQVVNFAVDQSGQIIVCDDGGGLWKLTRTPKQEASAPFPKKLSETGLFASTKDHTLERGIVPYSVNAPLWSDGAYKGRYIALPGESQIEYTSSRGWNFPEGAVLVKTFELELKEGDPASRRRLETRIITKQQNQWAGYTYIWNDAQDDATLAPAEGLDQTFEIQDRNAPGGVRKQTWHYPSRTECMVCHSRAANFVLGLSELQMNKDHDYGNGRVANQLRTLEHIGLLRTDYAAALKEQVKRDLKRKGRSADAVDALVNTGDEQRTQKYSSFLPKAPESLQRMVDPSDASADLNLRARAYLHANCAQCHVEAGGGNSMLEMEYTQEPSKMRLVNVKPNHDTFGLKDPLLIAPGDPDRSVLLKRIAHRGAGQMPPLATSRVDEEAVKLLHEWIAKMK